VSETLLPIPLTGKADVQYMVAIYHRQAEYL